MQLKTRHMFFQRFLHFINEIFERHENQTGMQQHYEYERIHHMLKYIETLKRLLAVWTMVYHAHLGPFPFQLKLACNSELAEVFYCLRMS